MLLPERFRPYHTAHIQRFADSSIDARRMGERREIAGLRKDGREFPAEASISHMDTATGMLFNVVLRDITDRKKVEETQRFLADASAVLARSLDYETTLLGLARLALPHLGDWCVIDLLQEDGTLRRIQAAHRDPELDELVQGLCAYPPEPARPHPSLTVLETGQPELIESVSDAFIEAIAADDEHLRHPTHRRTDLAPGRSAGCPQAHPRGVRARLQRPGPPVHRRRPYARRRARPPRRPRRRQLAPLPAGPGRHRGPRRGAERGLSRPRQSTQRHPRFRPGSRSSPPGRAAR